MSKRHVAQLKDALKAKSAAQLGKQAQGEAAAMIGKYSSGFVSDCFTKANDGEPIPDFADAFIGTKLNLKDRDAILSKVLFISAQLLSMEMRNRNRRAEETEKSFRAEIADLYIALQSAHDRHQADVKDFAARHRNIVARIR